MGKTADSKHLTSMQLSYFIDGEASKSAAKRIRTHLKGCIVCKLRVTNMRLTDQVAITATRVVLSQKEWKAIVEYIKDEEQILIDSYGVPRQKKKSWAENYKVSNPRGFKLQQAAMAVVEARRKRK
jgi:hypothetical protein